MRTSRKQAPRATRRRSHRWNNARRWGVIVVLAVILGIAGFAWLWVQQSGAGGFDSLVAQGQAALEQVRTFPSRGRDHVAPGTRVAIGETFPLSGSHWPQPAAPGFYQDPPPKGKLIHSLEHGNVIIYYDQLDASSLHLLRRWTSRFSGSWSGLLVVRHQGLGHGLVATAWRHRLDLPAFNAAALAAFINAYRGRGPEHPVR